MTPTVSPFRLFSLSPGVGRRYGIIIANNASARNLERSTDLQVIERAQRVLGINTAPKWYLW
jgi:hypothetical protein